MKLDFNFFVSFGEAISAIAKRWIVIMLYQFEDHDKLHL